MTTHTNLIARLRSGWTTDRLLAADALESLEQQVAALQQGGDAKAVQRMQDLENLVAALTKERDELKISNAFAHGEWRAVKDQVAALTDELNNIKKEAEMNQKWAFLEWRQRAEDAERQVAALTNERNDLLILLDNWKTSQGVTEDQLVAAQARESKLRELWEVVEKEYFARLKEQDEEAAKFEAEKDMYGWNFHKGLRGGLVEFHIYMTKIVKALALPTDDSELMERLKQEYERGYADAAEILTGVDRSMT